MKIRVLKEASTIPLQEVGHAMSVSDTPSLVSGPTGNFGGATGINLKKPVQTGSVFVDPLIEMLQSLGFQDVRFLGAGFMGKVYKVKNKENKVHAIKVVKTGETSKSLPNQKVFKWTGEKEIRAYAAIKKVRKSSKEMTKHFPEVFFIKEKNGFYLIGLELLTNKGAHSFKLQDLFQGSEATVEPAGDIKAVGAWKDLRKRMYSYLSNNKSRNKILDILLENIPEEFQKEIKGEMENAGNYVGQRENPALEKKVLEMIPKYVLESDKHAFISKKRTGDFGWDDPDDVDKPLLKDKWKAMPGVAYFVLKVLKLLREYSPEGDKVKWVPQSDSGKPPEGSVGRWGTGHKVRTKGKADETLFWQNSSPIVQTFSNLVNKASPVPMHYKPGQGREDRKGAPDEIAGVFPEATSIRQALEDLEKSTGLVAWDMHDKNAMIRPSDGAVVIVDAGMFRPRSEIRLREEKNCFSHNDYKTFKGKVKCIVRKKSWGEEKASAYVAGGLKNEEKTKKIVKCSIRKNNS